MLQERERQFGWRFEGSLSMKVRVIFPTLLIASAVALTGCNRPPAGEDTAAKAADAAPTVAATDNDRANAADAKRAAPVRAKRAKATPPRVRTAATMNPPVKIKNVLPEYPAIARAARVEGSVLLEVEVDREGKVRDAKVIRSVPLLDEAALEAVKQWEYTPMRRGGVAMPTTIPVTVNFTRS
jgi:TonB family protein